MRAKKYTGGWPAIRNIEGQGVTSFIYFHSREKEGDGREIKEGGREKREGRRGKRERRGWGERKEGNCVTHVTL